VLPSSFVGVACLAGVAVIILVVPVTARLAQFLQRQSKALMGYKDERIKIVDEVLSGMKVIKLQAWESSFFAKVMGIREKEIGHMKRCASRPVGACGGCLSRRPSLPVASPHCGVVCLGCSPARPLCCACTLNGGSFVMYKAISSTIWSALPVLVSVSSFALFAALGAAVHTVGWAGVLEHQRARVVCARS
jgi:hypothetical protein